MGKSYLVPFRGTLVGDVVVYVYVQTAGSVVETFEADDMWVVVQDFGNESGVV